MHEEPRRRAVALGELQAHATQFEASAKRHGVRNVRVFGSVAGGEADDQSDLDLLVDVEPWVGLFALSAFAGEVEDLLGVATQVATTNGLKPRVRSRVIAEAVAL